MTWMKRNIIIGCMSMMILLLYMTNILQNKNFMVQPLLLILLAGAGSLFIMRAETHMTCNAGLQKLQYENLDVFRFLSSIIIIILHVRPFFNISAQADIAINNIIGRICVPFFFLVSGFFAARQEQKKPDYIRSYIRSMIPVYLVWSAVYLPSSFSLAAPYIEQGLQVLKGMGIPGVIQILLLFLLIPLVILIALLYSGVYYHLWYFPALLLSMLVMQYWKKSIP